MKFTLNIRQVTSSINSFLYRHNFVIFIVIVIGSMSVVLLLVNNMVIASTNTSEIQSETTSTIDRDTLDRVSQLEERPDKTVSIPRDIRSNPFVE